MPPAPATTAPPDPIVAAQQRARAALRRPDPTAHPAAGDGERIGAGTLSQPANAVSSVAYVVAGAWLARRAARLAAGSARRDALVFAVATAANGPGGVAFHGRGDAASKWLHDAALLASLAVMAMTEAVPASGRPARPAALGPALVGCAAAAVAPRATTAISVALASVAGAGAVIGRRASRLPAAALLAVATVPNLATHSGARWHRPDAPLQGHAAWHVLTAAGLAAWGAAAMSEERP